MALNKQQAVPPKIQFRATQFSLSLSLSTLSAEKALTPPAKQEAEEQGSLLSPHQIYHIKCLL